MKDECFHALSSGYRRQIIHMLRWEDRNAGQIAGQFDIAQPSVSRHLEVLKKAGIVTVKRRGNQVVYSLDLAMLQEMILYLTEIVVGRV